MTRESNSRCCQCCEMLLLCCSALLLCLGISAEGVVVCREPGDNVTLECSLAGCSHGTDGYIGMYLYNYLRSQEEVLYYHSMNGTEKVTERKRYKNRVHKEGSLKNHGITISNLTVRDSGVYSCVYKKTANDETRCNVYLLAVRGAGQTVQTRSKPRDDLRRSPASPEVPSVSPSNADVCPPLVLVTTGIVLVSLLLTLIIIKILVPRVKLWTRSRRRGRSDSLDPSNYVYEVMTKSSLQPVAAPEPNPYDTA